MPDRVQSYLDGDEQLWRIVAPDGSVTGDGFATRAEAVTGVRVARATATEPEEQATPGAGDPDTGMAPPPEVDP